MPMRTKDCHGEEFIVASKDEFCRLILRGSMDFGDRQVAGTLYDVMFEVEALKAELARRKEVWEELGFASREDFEEWKAWTTAAGVFDMRAVARAKEKYGSPEEFAKQFKAQLSDKEFVVRTTEGLARLFPEERAKALLRRMEDPSPLEYWSVLHETNDALLAELQKDITYLKSKVKRSWFV